MKRSSEFPQTLMWGEHKDTEPYNARLDEKDKKKKYRNFSMVILVTIYFDGVSEAQDPPKQANKK